MASSYLQALASLCLVLLCSSCCLASRQSSPQLQSGQGECDIQNLKPLEPSNRIQHEAGFTESWDENHQLLRCAGVSVARHVIQVKGLLVPSYNNAPSMVFVLQGQAALGVVFPGCPETFQSYQRSAGQGSQGQQEEEPSFRDEHQKIHFLNPGDVAVLPTGIAHWVYNEGDSDVVLLVVHDISNRQNQLDQDYLRRFFFAGNQQQQEGQQGSSPGQQQGQKGFFWINIFQALDPRFLSRALRVSEEVVRKLRNEDDFRGFIIKVHQGLKFIRSSAQEQQPRGQETSLDYSNGFEETLCTARLKENLNNPERADIYVARGGSISTLNSFTLPILRRIQLSAGRGNLRPGAFITPYWNLNAHSVSFVTGGSGRIQVVGHSNKPVYDGEIRPGHLFIIPQNFIHLKQAGPQGLEWVSVKTNDNARISTIVGKLSLFKAVPVDVWKNTHQLTEEEVQELKFRKREITIVEPEFSSESESGEQQQQQQQQPGGGRGGVSPWSIVA